MPSPKRHHYLPEFYLKGFVRDDLLWLFDRKSQQYRQQAPKNTTVIGQYYTTTTESGEPDTSIEAHLSDSESEAAPIIGKLDAGKIISPEERVALAYFLALLLSRNPKHDREVEEIGDKVHKVIAKEMFPTVESVAAFLKNKGDNVSFSPESFFEFVHKEQFEVKTPREFTLNTMLSQSARFYREIAMMNWFVFHADGHASFITTDSPLGYVIEDEHRRSREPVLGFASEKVTKLIPLTSSNSIIDRWPWRRPRSLLGGPKPSQRNQLSRRDRVRTFRHRTRRGADPFDHPCKQG